LCPPKRRLFSPLHFMRSIYRKEINAFFSSVVGYVAVLVFLVAMGLFVWIMPDSNMLDYGYASMDQFFSIAPWLLMLLIPAITMRSFSDEFRGGTIEWLSTKPVSTLSVILGKYFAALTLVLFALVPTLVYVYSLNELAMTPHSLDAGSIIGSYAGLIFLAAGFAAIGVFCSSLTSNQVVGFLIALFACYIFYAGFEQLSRIPTFSGGVDYYLSMAGMQFHYEAMSRGVIDTRDVVYFISTIVLFAAATRLSLQSRTWDTAKA